MRTLTYHALFGARISNKPYSVPTDEELKAAKERFERERVTLESHTAELGQEVVRLFTAVQAYQFSTALTLPDAAARAFAEMSDYLKDFGDCADLMSETDKLHAFDVVQGYMDVLHAGSFSVCYAKRRVRLGDDTWEKRLPVTIAYLAVFPKGREPKQFAVERELG